jgi:cellulose synthase/poly-beta-1,6-N-acetylglucosamine synthase-like glycosyltransferase
MDVETLAYVLTRFAGSIAWFVIVAGLGQNAFHLWQLVLAARALRRDRGGPEGRQLWRRYAESAPPIALLVPAFGEELTIVESVRSLLSLQYPAFEVVVVNDGSRDGTLDALIGAFELEPVERDYELVAPCARIRGLYATSRQPKLIVVDKENGGKADALNAALNLSRASVVCSMDADSLLEPDALLRAVRPFVEDPERVVAVGGSVRIANGCDIRFGRVTRIGTPRNFLALLQTIEYLRAFLMARLAWSELKTLLIISGAFGLFRREAVLAVGGYSLGTVGEDMELVVKLHKHFRKEKKPYRVVFLPEPVCWTECPEDLAVLGRQRARWHRGALETFERHKDVLFNPKYGRLGTVGFGYILVVDVLGPFIELAGYILIPAFWLLGVLNTESLYAFLAVSFGFGVVLSVGALALEETELRRFPDVKDLAVLMLAGIVENFGYRQLNNVWRLIGTWQFVTKQHSWGVMTRRGFNRAPA